MTANNPVTYNEAEKRYEMPFGHLVVYANVPKDANTLYRLRFRAAGVARQGCGRRIHE
jgi:hypothetical protein